MKGLRGCVKKNWGNLDQGMSGALLSPLASLRIGTALYGLCWKERLLVETASGDVLLAEAQQ